MTMLTTTHSSIRTLRTCPKLYWYQYEQLLRPIQTPAPLRQGSAYHKGREHDDEPVEVGIQAIVDCYRDIPTWVTDQAKTDEWISECAKIVEMYRVFREQSRPKYEVLATEISFALTIPGLRSVRNCGVVDKVVQLDDGRVAVLECKTTAERIETDAPYWTRLRIDSQISRYALAAKRIGYEVQTVLYDVARKPGIKPRALSKKAVQEIVETGLYCGFAVSEETRELVRSGAAVKETPSLYGIRVRRMLTDEPSKYFAVVEIPRMTSDYEAFEERLYSDVDEVRFRRKTGAWQKNEFACQQFGTCAYLPLCSHSTDVTNTVPEGFERISSAHPELGESSTPQGGDS